MNSILQGISYVKLPEELCNSMKGLINTMYRIAQPDKKFVRKDYIKVEDQKIIYKNLCFRSRVFRSFKSFTFTRR